MTQENQTQGSNLEDRLLQIGNLNHLNRQIDKTKSPSDRFQLYSNLAEILSGGGKENPEDYKNIYGDIRVSPEEAVRYASEGMSSRAHDAEELYKQNKEKIVGEVSSSMNDTLKGSKNKAEAAQRLSLYFTDLIKVPEVDQATLDEMAQDNLAKRVGVSMNFSARGSMDKYAELQQRMYAGEFIKEAKNGNETTYVVDESKLGKNMDNIIYGSTVYSNSKAIEQAKQKEAQKKAS